MIEERRITRAGLWALAGLVLALILLASTAAAEDERLNVWLFGGQVIDKFSASARDSLVNPGARDEDAGIGYAVGLEFKYILSEEDFFDLRLFGQFIHSKRSVQSAADTSDVRNAAASEETFFELVRDATALEWLGGLQWTPFIWNDGETGLYLKYQLGFIQVEDANDDVFDNFFWGIGIEERAGVFEGSFVEVGGGKTDLFPEGERWARMKIGAALNYTPNGKHYSWYVEGWLDSDRGEGSDDIQIYFGAAYDVAAVLR